jgi:hypothetical protein
MTTVDVRSRFPFMLALGAVFAVLMLTSTAQAQSTAEAPSSGTQTPSSTTPAPWWELIGGYEFDTHDTGYAFFGPSYVHPFQPGVAWTANVFPNFLYYQFDTPAGTTQVRSPGVSSMVGLRFGEKNFFEVGAGPSVKWRKTAFHPTSGAETEVTDTVVGASAGAQLYVNPSARSNVHAQVNYNTADKYTWGRVGVKGQLNNVNWQGPNTTFLGVEGIGQGNQDITSVQVGGFFEVVHVPTNVSMAFKAGYKRSTFPSAPDKTGPYFAVTFYERLK